MSLMAAQHVLDDGEAEPGAAEPACRARFDAVEPLGEARQVLLGDAGPLVGDRTAHAGAAAAAPESAGAAVSAWASIRTVVPSPPYLMALSIRLTNS